MMNHRLETIKQSVMRLGVPEWHPCLTTQPYNIEGWVFLNLNLFLNILYVYYVFGIIICL